MTSEQRSAIERLIQIARLDTGQSRRCADFLLACHNAGANGGWDPLDLWAVDEAIADDMMTVLMLIRTERRDLIDHGFRKELPALWAQWRKRAPFLKCDCDGVYESASGHHPNCPANNRT